MNKLIDALLKISLFIFLMAGIIGFYYLAIGHEVYALTFAKVGGLFSMVFTTIVIGEVVVSKNARFATKFIWIAAFFIFQILAGIAYYLVDRKRINEKLEFS